MKLSLVGGKGDEAIQCVLIDVHTALGLYCVKAVFNIALALEGLPLRGSEYPTNVFLCFHKVMSQKAIMLVMSSVKAMRLSMLVSWFRLRGRFRSVAFLWSLNGPILFVLATKLSRDECLERNLVLPCLLFQSSLK